MVSTNIYNHHLIRNYDNIFHHISMEYQSMTCFPPSEVNVVRRLQALELVWSRIEQKVKTIKSWNNSEKCPWYYANCFIKARSAMTAIEENLRKEQTFCEKKDHLSKFILPDIFIPHFNGSNIPWEHFLDHFKHSKMYNSQSTDSEKFKFLTFILSCEALSVLLQLQFKDTCFESCWLTFIEVFNNSQIIIEMFSDQMAYHKKYGMV
ncbi:hypothetical protein ACFFRR_001232 [Megaselia abdita]